MKVRDDVGSGQVGDVDLEDDGLGEEEGLSWSR